MPNQNKYWAYFDEAWKRVIERFFPQLLQFFIPNLYGDVDFSKGISFLDKEMEQLAIRSVKGAKYVDKLVKVHLKDGKEQWILVHIEIQSYPDKEFSERMFRYFYKIFDRHGKKVVSMAILTGTESIAGEGRFDLKAYGSGVDFRYLTFRLMDYDGEELENNPNPIVIVVLASQERERAKRKGDKFNAKRYLIRKLYERGYRGDEIRELFRFIDWVLELSDDEEKIVWEEIKELEEVTGMPYITSVERIGMERGIEEGLQRGLLEDGREMVLEALDERFSEVPSFISNTVNQIEDRDMLKFLHRHAIRCVSLEEFKQVLDGQIRK